MTLAELTDAWNDLRNAALGRGVTPLVPQTLATDVGTSWELFRAWRSEQLGELPVLPLSGQRWVKMHHDLAARVRSAGVPVRDVPEDALQSALRALGEGAGTLWTGLKWLGVAAIVTLPIVAIATLGKRR
jgi:hypothetical protein